MSAFASPPRKIRGVCSLTFLRDMKTCIYTSMGEKKCVSEWYMTCPNIAKNTMSEFLGFFIVVDAMVMEGSVMHQWKHYEDLTRMLLLEQEIWGFCIWIHGSPWPVGWLGETRNEMFLSSGTLEGYNVLRYPLQLPSMTWKFHHMMDVLVPPCAHHFQELLVLEDILDTVWFSRVHKP